MPPPHVSDKPQTIRLCLLITGLATGGAERMLVKLLSGLDRSRIEPVVISMMDEGTQGAAISALGIPLHCVRAPHGKPSLRSLWRLQRLLKTLQPDVVHAWMYHSALAAVLAGCKAPVIAAIRHSVSDIRHERRMTRWVIRMLRFASTRLAAVSYNSETSRRQHEALGYRRELGIVIPNGFDCERFRPDSQDRKNMRKSLGIADDALVVGHIARFHPMKDQAGLLAACAQIAPAFPGSNFVLAGAGLDPGNPAIARWLEQPALAGRLHLLGERQDVDELMRSFDVFCLSSAWGEAFPNVLGEALASGVPCVATDVGDSAMIVGDAGLVVPAADANALSAALSGLLAMDRAQREHLGQLGRQRMLSRFGLAAIVARHQDLYQSVLLRTPRRR